MNCQESGKHISVLVQHCHLRSVKLHFCVVIHQVHLYPDGCVFDSPCQGNHFPLVVPVRGIHVNSCVTRRITIGSLQLFYIILSQWQIRRKNGTSHLAGSGCICFCRCLGCGNQSSRLYHGFSSAILNIFCRIQTKYRSGQSFSGFLISLFNGNLHLLARIAIRGITVNYRNFLACVGNLDFTRFCVFLRKREAFSGYSLRYRICSQRQPFCDIRSFPILLPGPGLAIRICGQRHHQLSGAVQKLCVRSTLRTVNILCGPDFKFCAFNRPHLIGKYIVFVFTQLCRGHSLLIRHIQSNQALYIAKEAAERIPQTGKNRTAFLLCRHQPFTLRINGDLANGRIILLSGCHNISANAAVVNSF